MTWGLVVQESLVHCFAVLGTLITMPPVPEKHPFPRSQRTTSIPHHQESESQDHYPHPPSFGRFIMIISDHFSAWRCHFSRLFSGLSKPSRKFIATQEPCQVGFSGPPKAPTKSGSFLGDTLWSGAQGTGHETVWSSSCTARGTCGKLPMAMPSRFLSGTMHDKVPSHIKNFKKSLIRLINEPKCHLLNVSH